MPNVSARKPVEDEFLKLVVAEVCDHFDNNTNDWGPDEGDIRVSERGPTSITLGLYKQDENGKTTNEETSRVIVFARKSRRPIRKNRKDRTQVICFMLGLAVLWGLLLAFKVLEVSQP